MLPLLSRSKPPLVILWTTWWGMSTPKKLNIETGWTVRLYWITPTRVKQSGGKARMFSPSKGDLLRSPEFFR